MYLYEVIEQNKMLTKKVDELRKMLVSSPDNNLSKELIDLLDKKQTLLVSINIANSQTKIKVGGQDIFVTNAIIIRDTIKEKMNMLTDLINSESSLDKLHLIQQRDKQYNDYLLIDMLIKKNDLNVTVGD